MNHPATLGPRLLGAMPFRMTRNRPRIVHRLSMWLLEVFVGGQLSVSIDDHPWRTFGPGEGVLYAPHTPYRERHVARGSVCESLCVFFMLDDGPAFETWRRMTPPFRVIDDGDARLMPLVEQVVRHHDLPGPDALLAQGALLTILGLLLAAREEGDTLRVAGEALGDDLPARLHRHMRANLGAPLTLARLADEMNMSVSGLSHAYQRMTGNTPMAALRRMRIEAAKTHLTSRRLSLAEIADLTGFSDAFHLSRTFKQLTGVSPRDYRSR